MCRSIGTALGKMHDAGVVHGDLTTSNIMVKDTPGVEPGFQIVMIDFGLGTMQPHIEDKAVDLYVLERAFISTHPGCELLVLSNMQLKYFLAVRCFTNCVFLFNNRHRCKTCWTAIDFQAGMQAMCFSDSNTYAYSCCVNFIFTVHIFAIGSPERAETRHDRITSNLQG